MDLHVSRRRWLAAAGCAGTVPWARWSLAAAGSARRERFVLVVLRGGVDGLTLAPALGDPAFTESRGALAYATRPWLTLDGSFGLHPLLPRVHEMFRAGELAVVHAVGLHYRERSHFDAQQLLESGGTRPYELTSGWLGRALHATGQRGVALTTAVPLALRGGPEVDTWAPSVLPPPATDLLSRLTDLYAADPALASALARSQALRDDPTMAGGEMAMRPGGTRALAATLATQAAQFLSAPQGPRVAVLEWGGWDSHTNQSIEAGALSANLRNLDLMLGGLRDGLNGGDGSAWRHTAVLVATEFGRQVAPNGTGGTDHGSGGAALLLGGAVAGGKVISDWPGLAARQRFEGRDLRITTDLRSLVRPLLADHLRVSRAALDREVLPGSAALPSLQLLRG